MLNLFTIGFSQNPIDFTIQEIQKSEFQIGKKTVDNKFDFPVYKIDDVSKQSTRFQTNNPEKQLQQVILDFLINTVIENTKQFPTEKHIYYLFYECYSISLFSNMTTMIEILKPFEIMAYVHEAYPNYRDNLKEWDMTQFQILFNQRLNNDFSNEFNKKSLTELLNEGFIPFYDENKNGQPTSVTAKPKRGRPPKEKRDQPTNVTAKPKRGRPPKEKNKTSRS